jgi:hypothetical protein
MTGFTTPDFTRCVAGAVDERGKAAALLYEHVLLRPKRSWFLSSRRSRASRRNFYSLCKLCSRAIDSFAGLHLRALRAPIVRET